jgi:hypothetical protein
VKIGRVVPISKCYSGADIDWRRRAVLALSLLRGSRLIARKTMALKGAGGTRTLRWRLPARVGKDRYRLLANARALTGASRGATGSDSIGARGTYWVTVWVTVR